MSENSLSSTPVRDWLSLKCFFVDSNDLVCLITNQPSIAMGKLSLEDLDDVKNVFSNEEFSLEGIN